MVPGEAPPAAGGRQRGGRTGTGTGKGRERDADTATDDYKLRVAGMVIVYATAEYGPTFCPALRVNPGPGPIWALFTWTLYALDGHFLCWKCLSSAKSAH